MAKGKSTKITKKVAAKSADFTKAKLKLGKGKQAASNATATSFKSKSVAMPSQSVSKPVSSGPVTKRNLGLDDIVIQAKHYSASVRKDSLSALRELCSTFPEIIKPKLSIIMATVSRLIADPDHHVRKAFLLFADWFLPLVSQTDLNPFLGQLTLHTTSALSSIYTDIKVDAVKFLETLICIAPATVSQRDNKLLGCLLTIIGIDSSDINKDQSNALSTLSFPLSSKIIVFEALSKIVELKYAEQSVVSVKSLPIAINCSWSKESEHQLYNTFPLLTENRANFTDDDFSCVKSQLQDLRQRPGLPGMSQSSSSVEGPSEIWDSLQSTLVALFLESAPTGLRHEDSNGTSITTQHLNLSACIIKICHTLCLALKKNDQLNDGKIKQFRNIFKHLGAYFPFESNRERPIGRINITETKILRQMSLNYASMVIVVDQSENSSKRVQSSTQPARNLKELKNVIDWLCGLLRGDPTPSHPLGCPLEVDSYRSLLPCIQILIDSSSNADRSVLETCIRHSEVGSCKKLSFTLIASIIESQNDIFSNSALRIWPAESVYAQLQQWISNLTKVLWEAGTKQPELSLNILKFLSKLAQKGSIGFTSQDTLVSLHNLLIPFFRLSHPSRGIINGPYSKLGDNIRKSALELAFFLDLCVEANTLRDTVSLVLAEDKALALDLLQWKQSISASI